MELDLYSIQLAFTSRVNDPSASPADKFVAYESAIRELREVVAVLEKYSGYTLDAAVRRLAAAHHATVRATE